VGSKKRCQAQPSEKKDDGTPGTPDTLSGNLLGTSGLEEGVTAVKTAMGKEGEADHMSQANQDE
jgi:hypothetical protein